MTIGERIKQQRKSLKLTLTNISQKTKLSTGNLSELENDKYAPSVASLILLSKALECSIDWLVTGETFSADTVPLEAVKEAEEENPPNDKFRLSELEDDMVMMFRKLDERDKEDVFDLIKLKYDRAVKRGKQTSLYSTYINKQQSNKGGTKCKDSGIA